MYIGGLDVGTSGCKVTVYDTDGKYVTSAYEEYDVKRAGGEHEIDVDGIVEAVYAVLAKAARDYELCALGVTSFGESFVALDENDKILAPSMLYTDPRGTEEVAELCEKLGEDRIISIAGVKPHSMYSLPKIMWIRKNKPEMYAKIKRIMLIEDLVVYKLSGVAAIDYSLAARTMALDIRGLCWSKEIFEAAGVDVSLMSSLVKTGSAAGKILPGLAKRLGISTETVIVNGCHDQVAAAVGAGMLSAGGAVNGSGTVECITPCFDTVPTAKEFYDDGYCAVPYVVDGTYVCYAFSFTGGAVLKWYRDSFARHEKQLCAESGENVYALLDSKIPEKPTGILVLPHFAGAATPYMDNGSRAAMIGLNLETSGEDIYKALMEGVAYEVMMNLEHLGNGGIAPRELYATGGGSSSPVWLQIKADILGVPITVIDAKEAGALGCCMLAAVAVGAIDSLEAAKEKFVKVGKTYCPREECSELYRKYYKAYKEVYDSVRPIVGKCD